MLTKRLLKNILPIVAGCILLSMSACGSKDKNGNNGDDLTDDSLLKSDICQWLTLPDKTALLQKQNKTLDFNATANDFPIISVDPGVTYQMMDGFGFALTGGSAYLLNKLEASVRDTLLNELFGNGSKSIGISYLRVSIGASDLSKEVFTYDEMPAGQTDMELKHFTLAQDTVDLIPVLKAILKINPDIKIMGSPWTPPLWMKSNKKSVGGSLQPEYYKVYASYFVKYITEMKKQGIHIDAITIQNEPLNPDNNPSLKMTSAEQAAFVKNSLGPAFTAAGLTTKIVLYDHNCDHPEYVTDILKDPDAAKYVDGSAFHLYGGDISAMSQVHNAFPEKNLYFTEQWVGGPGKFAGDLQWHLQNLIIGAPRNFSKNVLEWNLASDPSYNPHTPGGCTSCEGAITIGTTVVRNVSYYIIAHASKFVPSGSVRIKSDMVNNLPNVAFKTPEGKIVLIIVNTSNTYQSFNIAFEGKKAVTTMASGAVTTFVW